MRANLLVMKIIVTVFDILMIGNVSTDGGVARLWDICWIVLVSLITIATIYRLLNNFPSEVIVCDMALHQRC